MLNMPMQLGPSRRRPFATACADERPLQARTVVIELGEAGTGDHRHRYARADAVFDGVGDRGARNRDQREIKLGGELRVACRRHCRDVEDRLRSRVDEGDPTLVAIAKHLAADARALRLQPAIAGAVDGDGTGREGAVKRGGLEFYAFPPPRNDARADQTIEAL